MQALILLLLLCSIPSVAHSAEVTSVIDGDTLVVNAQGHSMRVRLYGIDCPERGQAFGPVAATITQKAVQDQSVDLRLYGKDKYGRNVGTVTLASGQTLQEVLLQSGAAWVYAGFCKGWPCQYWQFLEWKARFENAGLWADVHPVAPWEWRKERRQYEPKDLYIPQ